VISRVVLFVLSCVTALAQREYPSPLVREEQTVIVDGKPEVWRLMWSSAPKDDRCGLGHIEFTAPCLGFFHGESGDIVLLRLRAGQVIDRLSLSSFFEKWLADTDPVAIVQRWPSNLEQDFETNGSNYADRIRQRPVVRVMNFFDYDHDGVASEFYLHTQTVSVTHESGVVIGLSKENRKLHAFRTVSHPSTPLYLLDNEWSALRRAKGPIEVTDWTCGDHGAEVESTVKLHWSVAGIDGTSRTYTCPPDRRKLLSEEPLK
jgi:hypothetical protein